MFCLAALTLPSFALDVSEHFTQNSRFWSNNVSVSARPAYYLSFGADFSITEHKHIDNHIYTFRLPIIFRTDSMGFTIIPFFNPDNANSAYAYGGKITFNTSVSRDEIDETSSKAYLGIGFGAQKADVLKNDVLTKKDSFYQLAYEAGVSYNFFNQYGFDMTANVFQYLSGIEGVKHVSGVMNQQDLADLGTLDYVLGLPKGSIGAKMSWKSAASNSDNYISYRYIDFNDESATHSLMLSSTLQIARSIFLNLAYNHLFVPGTDRDIFGAGVVVKF